MGDYIISDSDLIRLYCVASAPLDIETNIDARDCSSHGFNSAEAALNEFQKLSEVCTNGFNAFHNTLTRSVASGSNSRTNVNLAVHTASLFAKRIITLLQNFNAMSDDIVKNGANDYLSLGKAMDPQRTYKTTSIHKEAATNVLDSAVDITICNKDFDTEIPMKNRVEFKTTTAVISDGKVEEEALKVTEFKRKSQRNPTGFHKFNFKNCGFPNTGFDSELLIHHTSSKSGTSNDGGSTRGSTNGVGNGPATSRSVSSVDDDIDLFRTEVKEDESVSGRNSHSVVIPFGQEREIIQDTLADPAWDEKPRHQQRFSRIRNRVPTGHASIMRRSSDEVAGLVEDFEKQLSALNSNSDLTDEH